MTEYQNLQKLNRLRVIEDEIRAQIQSMDYEFGIGNEISRKAKEVVDLLQKEQNKLAH